MYADWVQSTHNGTGGTGALTLAAVAGSPQPSDVWGISLTKVVSYTIDEYTDSTFATLKQAETGIGSINLSTGVLTRSVVLRTWVAGTGYITSGASAITVGATAANVRVMLTATANLMRPAQPALQSVVGDGWLPMNTRQQCDTNSTGITQVAGQRNYIPIEFNYGKSITAVGVYISAAMASSTLRVGVYDWDTDGLPGNLISEFTSATQISCAATGYQSVSVSQWLPPGYYYLCMQSSSTQGVLGLAVAGNPGVSGAGSRDIVYLYKGSTFGALPAVADKTSLGQSTRSAGNPMGVFCK